MGPFPYGSFRKGALSHSSYASIAVISQLHQVVDVLKSDEIKDFINEKYDGAVIPFEDSDDAEAEDTEAADADESADAEADTADEAAEETDAE